MGHGLVENLVSYEPNRDVKYHYWFRIVDTSISISISISFPYYVSVRIRCAIYTIYSYLPNSDHTVKSREYLRTRRKINE